jgi:thiaminase (transcriptional activator TenA)
MSACPGAEPAKAVPSSSSVSIQFGGTARWIVTYGAGEYGDVVRGVITITDGPGPCLAPSDRALIHRHFRTTSRYEWMFWDMGYRKESWPL